MKYVRAVSFGLVTLVLYLGVPLLGWGVEDLSGYFSVGPRTGYALAMACFAIAVAFQAIDAPEGITGSKGDESKRLRRQSVVMLIMVLVLYGALFFIPYADRREIGVLSIGDALRWSGIVLTAFGCILVFWSGVALGRMYSAEVTIQKDHHLITTGLYRYIRHPRYLGVICWGVGIALGFRSGIGLVVCILLPAILGLRIVDEEAVMHKEFGGAWEAYCRRSWRLIPLIY